jgi:hypothetical protein
LFGEREGGKTRQPKEVGSQSLSKKSLLMKINNTFDQQLIGNEIEQK